MSNMHADHWKETFTKLVFVRITARLARVCFSFLVAATCQAHASKFSYLQYSTHTRHAMHDHDNNLSLHVAIIMHIAAYLLLPTKWR